MTDDASPPPRSDPRMVPIVGRIVEDGRVEPLRPAGDERTPTGLARQDTLHMNEAWARFPAPPPVAPYKPPRKGKPWWKQPQEER